jgi:hypothetical protein
MSEELRSWFDKWAVNNNVSVGDIVAWNAVKALAVEKQAEIDAMRHKAEEDALIETQVTLSRIGEMRRLNETIDELRAELESAKNQEPVAYKYVDSSGKYKSPMLEFRNDVLGYHECWKPEPLYSKPFSTKELDDMKSFGSKHDAATEPKKQDSKSELSERLADAIKIYGECCHNYGLGNPLNIGQLDRLYALTQDSWLKISNILEEINAANV